MKNNKHIKVIFLDVDGVLNCKTTTEVIWRKSGKKGFRGVEDEKLELLSKIVKTTGAYIVLSSTWRLNKVKSIFDDYVFYDDWDDEEYEAYDEGDQEERSAYKYLEKRMSEHGLSIYDDTPDSGGAYSRGKEIHAWLEQHLDVSGFVIIDDEEFHDFYTYNLDAHVVYTTYSKGLTEKTVEEAIAVLMPRT